MNIIIGFLLLLSCTCMKSLLIIVVKKECDQCPHVDVEVLRCWKLFALHKTHEVALQFTMLVTPALGSMFLFFSGPF